MDYFMPHLGQLVSVLHFLRIRLECICQHTVHFWPLGTRVYKTLSTTCKQHERCPDALKVLSKQVKKPKTLSWFSKQHRNSGTTTVSQACSHSNTSASPSNCGSSVNAKYISTPQWEFSCSSVIWEYREKLNDAFQPVFSRWISFSLSKSGSGAEAESMWVTHFSHKSWPCCTKNNVIIKRQPKSW